MDKTIAAFVVIMVALVGVLLFIGLETIPSDVGIPIVTTVVGAAIMYVFPRNGTAH